MKIIKRPPDPRHLRSALPRGFGWIDHRFLTEGYLRQVSPHALGLYCLLVCAADAQGLSYYSDQRLRELLALDGATLLGARRELVGAGLVAYQKPLWQVLALEDSFKLCESPRRSAHPAPRPAPPNPPPQEEPRPALPRGLDLRAMVAASLRAGGIV